MKVAITGASGLVGTAIGHCLRREGHLVVPMVRRAVREGAIGWNPSGPFDPKPLEGMDCIIHLAGESIVGARWTAAKRRRIRQSRVEATENLCRHLVRLDRPPATLLSASAIGYYGDRGDEVLEEGARPGDGFLARVAIDWEAATEMAGRSGIRVVNLRFGMVLSSDGGALAAMMPIFRWGLGGRLGSGRQYWSWIAIDDAVWAIFHAMTTPELSGPVNIVAPNAVQNVAFTRTLAAVLGRPAVLPVPRFLLRLGLGAMADELLLASTRAVPRRLLETGFEFRLPQLEPALRTILHKR